MAVRMASVIMYLCIYVFRLFIYFVVFNGAVSRSNYVASNGRVRSA